jgi:hypothetical protein
MLKVVPAYGVFAVEFEASLQLNSPHRPLGYFSFSAVGRRQNYVKHEREAHFARRAKDARVQGPARAP